MTPSNRVVFVATSAAPGRDYRGEFLNAFAYPSGHHVFFRYRAKWITREFRHALDSLKMVRCILVFCDPADADQFSFYPVRHCKIVDVDVPRPGAVLKDDDQVALRLELGDFVHPDMSSTQDFANLINSDAERPYPLGSAHTPSSRFVFARDAESGCQ